MHNSSLAAVLLSVIGLSACSSDNNAGGASGLPLDPDGVAVVSVDRFSDAAGHLQKRTDSPELPAPNAPIDFDQGPFITRGFGPSGQLIQYYNFDVQPTAAAPIYVLMQGGMPVEHQLNIIDVIPGDAGYNDFWQIVAVTVPSDYVANTITSAAAVVKSGYAQAPTKQLVNCPVVPDGSSAKLRYAGDTSGSALVRGWYKDQVVTYFTFGEKAGGLNASGSNVPTSPIYVTFNDDSQGPASGFKTEPNSQQTHNVVATLPTDAGYSPLWAVIPYPNTQFTSVMDLSSAVAAHPGSPAGNVNCPVVSLEN